MAGRKKKDNPESSNLPVPRDVDAIIKMIDDQRMAEWQSYRKFLDSIRLLPAIDRAEAWLRYMADAMQDFGDAEALIYLRSRGEPLEHVIEYLIDGWRARARERVVEAETEINYVSVDAKQPEPPAARRKLDRVNIETDPFLRNFWDAYDHGGWHIEATMLRVDEWCSVAGFDQWWKRLARQDFENIALGGFNALPGVLYLFSQARSPLCRAVLKRSLDRMLEAAEISTVPGHDPWQHFRPFKQPRTETSVAHLASVAFAQVMLRGPDADRAMLKHAIDSLVLLQKGDGSWGDWEEDDKGSVVATAMAIHALSVSGIAGTQRVMNQAAAFLLESQSDEGPWQQKGVDPTFLTVLALDALELARGGDRTTMNVVPVGRIVRASRPAIGSPRGEPGKRFAVALSFPGELRPRVEAIAELLTPHLTRQRILYDRFHTAEFARPNLDVYLQRLYHDESELIVVFLCADYEKKQWCGLEARAIRDLLKKGRQDQIMIIRTDFAPVSGFFSLDGAVDLPDVSDQQAADLILTRLQQVHASG
jgi:hypothetical protein